MASTVRTAWSMARSAGTAMLVGLVLSGCATGPRGDERMKTDPSVVQVDSGTLKGTIAADHRAFLGIPYAAARRWQAPQAVPSWADMRDATRPGPFCPQMPTEYASDVEAGDERCLFLNVTTPLHEGLAARRPVMMWIHGDGTVGAGSLFDARRLAVEGDVVVVTINYRLGIFGGFGFPGLQGSGTFGLQDQQAALRWVQRNIGAFGGDPSNVTLFGQSYGALSVSAHLTSPSAEGLFHRAIVQSGFALMDLPAGAVFPGLPALPSWGWRSRDEVEGLGTHVAGLLGCGDPAAALECLRRLPASTLVAHTAMFTPYAFGTDILPDDPARALREGRFHRVPTISGATRDEHRLFVGLFYELGGPTITISRYRELLAAAFGAAAPVVARQYPAGGSASPAQAWADVLTDRMWAQSTFAQHHALAQYVPTYAYEFADCRAPMYLPFPETLLPGAFHAAEVPYLFADENAVLDETQRDLSRQMILYWTQFARAGNPNGVAGLPLWPRFDASAKVFSLAPGHLAPTDYAATHQLGFWASLR